MTDTTKTIAECNEPLHEEMVKKGYSFKGGKGYQYYVDRFNKFIPYPVGYITGPSLSLNTGSPRPLYVSVQGHDGWHQRSFKQDERELAEQWAVSKSEELTKS